MAKAVTALFQDREHAKEAIKELKDMGYGNDITVVAKDTTTDDVNTYKVDKGPGSGLVEQKDDDAVKGAVTGGVLGGIVGLLAGVAAVAVPGGILLAAGPLAATLGLTGVVTGAALGGLVGALMDMGVSEDRAQMYKDHIESGDVFVAVNAGTDQTSGVQNVFSRHGANETDILDTKI
jgi:uncharacterized membrane protein